MRQHQLQPPEGSRHPKKRVGRGDGSGQGKTAGRGYKGQKARTGTSIPPYFEGGQNPTVKRLPFLRGFTNIFRTEYEVVNVGQLGRVAGDAEEVTPERLAAAGLVRGDRPVKVLGDGALNRAVTVRAAKFTASARQKIEAAGGRAEEITRA